MPLLDLTEDEHAERVRLVRQANRGEQLCPYPRAKRLKSILRRLDPASIERTAKSYPRPKAGRCAERRCGQDETPTASVNAG